MIVLLYLVLQMQLLLGIQQTAIRVLIRLFLQFESRPYAQTYSCLSIIFGLVEHLEMSLRRSIVFCKGLS